MKIVPYIENVPDKWRETNDFGSHKSLLWVALNKTGGGYIVEMGMGFESTPNIAYMCNKNRDIFVAYETNKEWFEKCKDIDCEKLLIDDYMGQEIGKPDLLFIDCAPGELRRELIKKHAWDAKVIMVHDTELSADFAYRMQDVLFTFKYRLDYTPINLPHTTLLSNWVNVEEWL